MDGNGKTSINDSKIQTEIVNRREIKMGQKTAFKLDNEMEMLSKLRDKQPENYKTILPAQKMALGLYLSEKEAEGTEGNQQTQGEKEK
jgi:hypothetical protein